MTLQTLLRDKAQAVIVHATAIVYTYDTLSLCLYNNAQRLIIKL